MNLFDNFVRKAIGNITFVDIDRPNYESESIFGIIFQQSEDFLAMKEFSEVGEYDGVTVIRKDDVSEIGTGGNQRSSNEQLVVNPTEIDLEISIDLASMRSILESISSKFSYVAIYQEEYSTAFDLGEILEIDDEFILLHRYGTKNGLDRSQVLLRLDSITRVQADGKYEKSILEIFSKR